MNKQTLQWKAHDSVVLVVAWSSISNLIASGSEDCHFKIWDALGQLLFNSPPRLHPITSISWSPDGSYCAFTTFSSVCVSSAYGVCLNEQIRCRLHLCQPSHCFPSAERYICGLDGGRRNLQRVLVTGRIAAGCRQLEWKDPDIASGQRVCWLIYHCTKSPVFFSVTPDGLMNWNDEFPFRGITWASYHVAKIAPNVLHLRDNLSETTEVLEFKDDVVLWSFKYGYLLIASQSQCLIHKENGWNSPVTVELRDKCPQFIKQTERFFTAGFHLFFFNYSASSLLYRPSSISFFCCSIGTGIF